MQIKALIHYSITSFGRYYSVYEHNDIIITELQKFLEQQNLAFLHLLTVRNDYRIYGLVNLPIPLNRKIDFILLSRKLKKGVFPEIVVLLLTFTCMELFLMFNL